MRREESLVRTESKMKTEVASDSSSVGRRLELEEARVEVVEGVGGVGRGAARAECSSV